MYILCSGADNSFDLTTQTLTQDYDEALGKWQTD